MVLVIGATPVGFWTKLVYPVGSEDQTTEFDGGVNLHASSAAVVHVPEFLPVGKAPTVPVAFSIPIAFEVVANKPPPNNNTSILPFSFKIICEVFTSDARYTLQDSKLTTNLRLGATPFVKYCIFPNVPELISWSIHAPAIKLSKLPPAVGIVWGVQELLVPTSAPNCTFPFVEILIDE